MAQIVKVGFSLKLTDYTDYMHSNNLRNPHIICAIASTTRSQNPFNLCNLWSKKYL